MRIMLALFLLIGSGTLGALQLLRAQELRERSTLLKDPLHPTTSDQWQQELLPSSSIDENRFSRVEFKSMLQSWLGLADIPDLPQTDESGQALLSMLSAWLLAGPLGLEADLFQIRQNTDGIWVAELRVTGHPTTVLLALGRLTRSVSGASWLPDTALLSVTRLDSKRFQGTLQVRALAAPYLRGVELP